MPSPTKNTSKVPLYPTRGTPRLIDVAPGQTTVALPPGEVPRVLVAELVPTGEPGTYRAIARVNSAEVRLSEANLKKLNLGIQPVTLKRLIKAGFVAGCRIAPGCYTFQIESYYAHVARMQKAAEEGTDFWTGENLTRYRTAL